MEAKDSGVLRALDATTPVRLGVHNALPKEFEGSGSQGAMEGSNRSAAVTSGGASDGTLAGFSTLEDMLEKYLPEEELAEAMRVLHGYNQGKRVGKLPIVEEVAQAASEMDLDVKAFQFEAAEEELRQPRKVVMGLVQNSIDVATTEPFKVQKQSLIDKIESICDLAGKSGVQVLCLQEAWNMPFAFCTREKRWCEFAEDLETGASMVKIKELAKKWDMVIVTTILERDAAHSATVWNTAVVVGHNGNIIGKHRWVLARWLAREGCPPLVRFRGPPATSPQRTNPPRCRTRSLAHSLTPSLPFSSLLSKQSFANL